MIKSLNKEINEQVLETVVNELEERPEMLCSGNGCVVNGAMGIYCEFNV